MSLFNDNHTRTLRCRFEYVDGLLDEAVRLLDGTRSNSPFSPHVPDAAPVQRKVVADYAQRVRDEMRQFMQSHGIDLPRPHVSSIWAARTTISSAEVAIEELKPKYMRGYGELSEQAARELDALVSRLEDLLRRMESFLAQGAGKDLRSRMDRLERAGAEVDLLRRLEAVITAHGLVEFRPALDALIDRAESAALEVGVFGRVSSGKSSLLDYLLGTDVLPVGVTPVTAIPTRIVHGPAPRAVVHFADASPMEVEPQRVADFVTEQRNPANARHVTRIQVELPSPRLREGITFVDTPGLSSLATAGSAEALAYLPRCDLGIVLIDASSTPAPDDVTLVHALYQAGAEVMVLLSKADVLAVEDRQRMAGYVAEQLAAHLGREVPVHLVSVRGADAAMADRWIAEALMPALGEHRRLAAAAFHRKAGALKEAVVSAIRRRLDRPQAATGDGAWQEAEQAMAAALVRLERARFADTPSVNDTVEQTLDELARSAAADWNGGGASRDLTGAAAAALHRTAQELAAGTIAELTELRQALTDVLRLACRAAGRGPEDADQLPEPRGMPALDGLSVPRLEVRRPVLARLNAGLLQRRIRTRARTELGPAMGSLLNDYQKRLEEWRRRVLREMHLAFVARFDYYRGQAGGASGAAGADGAGLRAALAELAGADEAMARGA
jgi:GTP-binding protein EngB required for normal cell division